MTNLLIFLFFQNVVIVWHNKLLKLKMTFFANQPNHCIENIDKIDTHKEIISLNSKLQMK